MNLDRHLKHLLRLMEPPATEGWKQYAWARAKELAAAEPELASLPDRLAEEMQKRGRVLNA